MPSTSSTSAENEATLSSYTTNTESQTDAVLSGHSPRKEKLRRKIKFLNGRSKVLEKKIKRLSTSKSNKLSDITAKDFKQLCGKFLPKSLSEIVQIQVDLNTRKKKGNRYTLEYKKFALTLHFFSPKAYKFLQQTLKLPATRTLRLFTQSWQFSPGDNDFIYSCLKIRVNSFNNDLQRYFVLCADEMSLKSFLFYSINNDEVVGLHHVGRDKQLKPASMVLTFMVRSICGRWKQPICYYFTKSGCQANSFRSILYDLISKLNKTGIKICAFVTDMGSNFVQFTRLEGITPEKPFFLVDNEKVFYIFDVPHLIKAVRNNLIKYDFHFGEKVASWQHIVDFYKRDQQQNLRLAPKLTDAHIYPNGFQKMKVKSAVQVLSHTVASSIYTYVSLGALNAKAAGTAEFLEMFDSLFDILNSSSVNSDKVHRKAWTGSSTQLDFLNKILDILKSLIVRSKDKDVTKTIKCLSGLQITIHSFLQLWNFLKGNSFSFVFTRRLNQDCLENFFGSIRQQSGNASNPTPIQFTRAFKKLVCLNYFQHSEGSNCDEDFDSLLTKVTDIQNFVFNELPKPSNESDSKSVKISCIDYRDNLPGTNALNYVCGYLIRKCLEIHSCDVCISYSQESSAIFDSGKFFVHFKAYENKNKDTFGNLKTPAVNFYAYIQLLEDIFTEKVLICLSGSNVASSIITFMKDVELIHPCDRFPKEYLVKLFVRMRIFYALKYINRDFKSSPKKNEKLIKISHL